MSLPLVSCLMPTTESRQRFHARARAMFEAQDWPNKELIVIDGPGTIGAKLNDGIRRSTGDILINWDDDDWSAPDRIARQVGFLCDSGTAVVGLSELIFYAEGQSEGWAYTGDGGYAPGSTHCYTREYVQQHPHQDMNEGGDALLFSEAAALKQFAVQPAGISLVACDHPGNTCPRRDHDMVFLYDHSPMWRKVPFHVFASTVFPYRLKCDTSTE